MKVVVNGGMGFPADVDLNPRGLHANSGTRQWEDETLVTVQYLATTSGKYRVVELPARATTLCEPRANGRRMRFDTEHQAECWIERNYPSTVVLVQHEDITEEIERRKQNEDRLEHL